MDTERTTCQECGLPAEVSDRAVLQSTDGPVAHVKVRCVEGHWFFMEEAALAAAPSREPAGAAAR